jgi:hypothetical protein
MLICYTLVGGIVYVALILLGEMATQYPVAGMLTFLCLSPSIPSLCFVYPRICSKKLLYYVFSSIQPIYSLFLARLNF